MEHPKLKQQKKSILTVSGLNASIHDSKEKYLKPLNPRIRKIKYAVFDIESNGWINFEMLGFYDGKSFKIFNNVDSFLDHALSDRYRGFRFYAHNGGRFDFLFLIDPLIKRNLKFRLVEQGARITALTLTKNKRKYTFTDSFPVLNASLKKLSETFTPEHSKLSGAIDFEKERVDKNNPLHQKYLEHDCKSLYEIIKKFQELPFIEKTGLKMTAASTALAAFRTTMPHQIRRTSNEVNNFIRKSYAGGRVEIFKQYAENYKRYDVNSLFPAQMLKPIPMECRGISKDYTDFGFHDVEVYVPDIYIPVLYKHINGKLTFPTGYIRGVFFSEELKMAVKCGAKIIKFHGGYSFNSSSRFFQDFVESLYKIREDYPSGTPQNFTAKLLLNSCYGKFAERDCKNSIIRVDPLDTKTWPREFEFVKSEKLFLKSGLLKVEKTMRPVHGLVHIGAAITAYARIQMHEQYYQRTPSAIIYTDTDSIDTVQDFATNKGLGHLKLEHEINRGFYLLPKAYYLELNNGKYVKKIKGFKIKHLENADFNSFKLKNIQFNEKRIATFRQSIIRNSSYLSLVDHKRRIKANYDKRVFTNNGDTRPWFLTKNGELK